MKQIKSKNKNENIIQFYWLWVLWQRIWKKKKVLVIESKEKKTPKES
jgi:hypothetical protein